MRKEIGNLKIRVKRNANFNILKKIRKENYGNFVFTVIENY